MSGSAARTVPGEAPEAYAIRIEAHLVRLAHGHDRLGHLFAIERLARAARADWWAIQQQPGPRRDGP